MLTPFPCSSPHGEDRLCELLARYWRRQHPAFLYHPGGDLAKWGPHVMPPRQPFLGQGSKLGRNGETRRPAGAETGKRGGQPGPKRGKGGHKHWDDCARPRNIDYATTEGLGTTDAARFGSYLRSICLSEAEAWTCKSSGCPQHLHGTIGTPT